MKIEKRRLITRTVVDSSRERRAMIAMITSKEYLSKAARIIDTELLDVAHYQQVAEWCLSYWKRWKKPPGEHIEDIYHRWSAKSENKELVKAVHDFLDGLSKEYDSKQQLNIPFLLDELAELMRSKKLARIKQDLDYLEAKGRTKEAEKLLLEFKRVKDTPVGDAAGFDPMSSKLWNEVFAERLQPLIHFEGDAGLFFNSAFTRDALIGLQATEKTGKTFWAMEFAIQGLIERRRVAFFQVGDLSKNQIMRRFGMRWARRPMYHWQIGKVKIPLKIIFDKTPKTKKGTNYRFVSSPCTAREPMDEESVIRGIRRFKRSNGLSKKIGQYLRVSIHPNSSINVAGIEDVLDQWLEEDDFVPDIIIIDYADILASEPLQKGVKQDRRDLTNETWKALRRLSQQRHCLVLVPTQANAKAYKQSLQSKDSFSEDKRKNAHVTGMMGFNQTVEEKQIGGMRINWLFLREAPFDISRPLYVGTCFPLGRAMCCAAFRQRSKKISKRKKTT